MWVQRSELNYKDAIRSSASIIMKVWPELCQKNHNEIILLEFMTFAVQALRAIQSNSLDSLENKERIEDFVDTIPNPPSINRFKQAIALAKKISNFSQEGEEDIDTSVS